ncbi:MAG: ABC transporter ATP-binding protein [Candidatus Riflebacteria bacterium HGW-Riflebacteria-2]|jgi:ATP-binding cassette subfamily B protein|nr:MAG: ABC transporter ATP-binding protein [Candidatus Riflebacteria bacterium HGW-Riflebacteria-2]
MNQQAQNHITAQKYTLELLRPYRRHLLYGVSSLIIVDIADIMPPIIIKLAIDAIERGGEIRTIVYCGIGLLVTAIIQAVFRFFWRQFFLGTSHKSVYDLRKALFSHLLKLPFHYFSRTRTGDIMSRLTNDIQEIRFMLGIGVLITLDASFYFLTIPFIMIWLSPKLTLITLLPFLMMPILVVLVKNTIHNRSRDVQARLSDLSSKAEENLSGIRVIKGFHTEDSEISRFSSCGREFVKDKIRLANVEAFFHPALDLVIAAGMVILLYFGGNMVVAGTITLGSFMAFEAYMLKLSWPMMAVGWIINLYQRSMASMERCLQILREPVAQSLVDSNETDQKPVMANKVEIPAGYAIELADLCFTYPGASQPALKNISFKLPEGRTLGITGPVGCGKSTLLRLLMKMFSPESGQIRIGGKDSHEIDLPDLRRLFSYVPQETFLFSETIRENILFACSDKTRSEAAEAFAQRAGLADDLKDFSGRLETMLGERGVNLSGGQKQRVSLARALAAERPILVLDDCTSAVDTETEQRILSSLQKQERKQTCIIVSHRMVSLQNADLIIYLDGGEVVESGSHAELLQHGGRYARAWERQRIKAQLEEGS